jgi:putative methyltransferase (TIGR04325 family)
MGWDTPMRDGASGWSDKSVVDERLKRWQHIVQLCGTTSPLAFSYESDNQSDADNVLRHNLHLTFGYVLALAAKQRQTLSILDWGGGLGHYYLISKALLPGVDIDYHCVEVRATAEAGRSMNPGVTWYSDDRWAERSFDLVMVNASLQYVQYWEEFIDRISRSVTQYFLLTRIPVVERGPGFVAVQREARTKLLHYQFNKSHLLDVINNTGLTLVREFIVGDRLYIRGAPEQCEMRGWLFKR